MLTELEKICKNCENSNKEPENIKKNQTELRNTLTEKKKKQEELTAELTITQE